MHERDKGSSELPTRAQDIPGWMSDEELAWLAEKASQCKIVIEIGVWKGRSTFHICQHCPGTVFSIDIWRPPPGVNVYHDPDGAHQEALRNLKPFIDATKLFIVEMRSITAIEYLAPLFKHCKPEWAFIDGDHNPWVVQDEIDRLRWLGVPLISGHDHDEVKKGLPDKGVVRGPGTIWWLEKPSL